MSDSSVWETIEEIIDEYVGLLHDELAARWDGWKIDLAHRERYEVVGGLLARQVTLASQIAFSPNIWNGHVAPIILRTMIDTHITLAWIMEDLPLRAQKYIEYGLGQEKLNIEHRKAQLLEEGENPDDDLMIKASESWSNSQLYTFLTKVTIGSWSGKSTREMAEEANLKGLYNYAYTPFSAATHSMWNHVGRYNLITCPNPLHGAHKVPYDPVIPPDPDYLYRAAKYVGKSLKLFDIKTGVAVNVPSALNVLSKRLAAFGKKKNEDKDNQVSGG